MPCNDPEIKRARDRAYGLANREKISQNKAAYYQKRKARIANGDTELGEKLRRQNREISRRYRLKHPDKVRACIRAWRDANPEHVKEYKKAYNLKNAAKIRVYRQLYYQLNKGRFAARWQIYYALHSLLLRQKRIAYYVSHAEESRAYTRTYRAKNLEKVQAGLKAYRLTHRDKIRADVKKRRARKRNAPINDFTDVQWQDMQKYYHGRCVYCEKKHKKLTQDHLTPLAKGGSHTKTNIVPACRSCNSKKFLGPPLIPVQLLLL